MTARTEHERTGVLALVLAALAMLGPFSIDAVFPGFPDIGRTFDTPAAALQQIISLYLLAYACASLFHGSLSDAYGRKPVMIIGMGLYAVASAGAALATSYGMLLAFRVFQGICGGAGMVVGRAMIRDRLHGEHAQRLMSRVMMIFAVAPALAPVVGAWLLGLDGWRGIFWVLSGYALCMMLAVAFLLPESHPPEQREPFVPKRLIAGYKGILGDSGFWPLVVSSMVNFSALFLYIASAPAIVLVRLHLGTHGFPWLFVPVVVGLMAGGALSGRVAGRMSDTRTVGLGYVLMMTACALHLILGLTLHPPSVPWSLLPLTLQGLGVQLAFPTLTLLLLDRFPLRRGAVSSLQAGLSLLGNAFVAGVLSAMLSGTMLRLAIGSTILTLVGVIAWMSYVHAGKRMPNR